VRKWLGRLDLPWTASLAQLNAFAEEAGVRVENGTPLRFVPPNAKHGRYGAYEISVFESGCVHTRPGNTHDLFNALAWLAFPRTKARLNALHAQEIPRESGRRGRFRDLLTVLDEGGVIVECGDPRLAELLRGFRWKELFWENRARVLGSMRLLLLGHAALEQALEPRPGITCKAIFVDPGAGTPDERAAAWLGGLSRHATPKDLAPLPVFGFPGWSPGADSAEFYDDTRYFRPSRRASEEKSEASSIPSK
jgi:hypothetical protein